PPPARPSGARPAATDQHSSRQVLRAPSLPAIGHSPSRPRCAGPRYREDALGSRRIDGYEAGGFLVMTDPEGNEFCLVPVAPFSFDESGHADYLDDLKI